MGLPWLGIPWDERRASVPSIQAILVGPGPAQLPAAEPGKAVEPVGGRNMLQAEQQQESIAPPPPIVRPAAKAGTTTASMQKAKVVSPDVSEPERVAVAAEEKSQTVVRETGAAVLSTDKESSWKVPVEKAVGEKEVRDEPAAVTPVREADALEQSKTEEAEKLAQAVAAKASQEAVERKLVEEQARIEAEKLAQAAAARASQEAVERKLVEEQARIEAERLAQAAAAKAGQEAMERRRAGELARGRQDQPEGGGQDRTGRQGETGAALARRALDQARSGLSGPVVNEATVIDRRRRGSILGADPRNIQLAFYGEGWRQKVERIGSLNYPKLSKDRFYDTLVVTVSINSDGTLAGVRIDKSSGYKDLDDAVRRIVEMSAPFAAFPPELKRSYDFVDITRTWTFDERPRMSSQ